MQRKAWLVVCVLLLSFVLLYGQKFQKPRIAGALTLPSEPIPRGACTASKAGYLEKDGKTMLTERELGHAILGAIRGGYVVTIYPETKRGIFVRYDCPAFP